MNKKFIFPDIRQPNNIIFLFYEGNGLENNIHYYNVGDKLRDRLFVKSSNRLCSISSILFLEQLNHYLLIFKANEIKKVNTIEIDTIEIK